MSSSLTKLKVRKCCFIGLPGSGKTYCSKIWSKGTGVARIDLDKSIELEYGASISQIFDQNGEAFFRQKESLMLQNSLKKPSFILDPGGGVVENVKNRELIKNNCLVIYLYCPLPTLEIRLNNKDERSKRPLLQSASISELNDLIVKRSVLYENMADITLHSNYAEECLPSLIHWWKSSNC